MVLFAFCSPSQTMRAGWGVFSPARLLYGVVLATMLGTAPLLLVAQTAQTPLEPAVSARTTRAPLAQAALARALDIEGTLAVVRIEGLASAQNVAVGLFPDKIDAGWTAKIERLYAPAQMWARFGPAFDAALKGQDVAPILAFFTSPEGRRLINLEIVTRRAMLDPAREEQARQNLARMRARQDPRLKLLGAFIAANDMIELNVVIALNSDLALYHGLKQGNALPDSEDGARIVQKVQAQQEAIRRGTIDRLYSYLALAYEPLSDTQLRAYIAFSRRPAGQLVNRALFEAFNAMFDAQSHALGQAAAAQMNSQDL